MKTGDAKLKKRLSAFSGKYPELWCQSDDDGQGGLWFEIDKHGISIRLAAPYSEERCKRARVTEKERYCKNYHNSTSSFL